MVYLTTSCDWDANRLKSFKTDNSYKLFEANHIDNVRLGMLEHGYRYVKASCVPETRQSDVPYCSWLLYTSMGYIQTGGCTCVALFIK
ncbi:hypothetical protein KUTeg_012183 [Tegillarca granosa]|uniref:Uncharacterized protein n=1 Tax=Tegillarca granosa TaxID=220873 RepID=A0ABQ9F3Z8_TEGGR|nr:hypothetical protein KUTeg_012183 [Tegillarca granosa]